MSSVRKKVAAVLGSAITLAALVVATPGTAVADHEEQPTVAQLLEQCNNGTDRCEFHVESVEKYLGPEQRVTSDAYNCTSVNQNISKTWSDTTTTGTSTTQTIEFGGAFEAFTAGFSSATGKTWEKSHTETHTESLWIGPRKKGWLTHRAHMVKSHGYYQLNFGDRYYGHYVWYVNDVTMTGIDPDNTYGESPVFREAETGTGDC
ncbi:hypothetical protein ACFPH6_15815 [Streptomyces xiangluensis]|uniref:Uncharacterized protein n=1 Tax=Streptomyces xiangluensis TaxID=2665720 RepID=A0ABV8YPI6_9ACTN